MSRKANESEEEAERRLAAYEKCKRRGLKAERRGAFDDALFWLFIAAQIGWAHHFGRWIDAEIEEALPRIAEEITRRHTARIPPQTTASVTKAPARLVHLTSNVLDTGGHTEIMLAWSETIERWGGIEQSLISSEWLDSLQVGRDKLNLLTGLMQRCHLCPLGISPVEKVLWLYQRLMKIRPQTIVLHINPDDVFSLCAALMLRHTTGARIVFFNHADDGFSAGLSLADRVIEFREASALFSRFVKKIEPRKLWIVPLTSRLRPRAAKMKRAEFGIPEGCTVSLTVAQLYKLLPDGHWNYGQTIKALLEREPDHYHILIGPGPEEIKKRLLDNFQSSSPEVASRFIRLEGQSEIAPFLMLADFLIESFPRMGGILRIDAMRHGLPIVAVRNTALNIFSETGALPADYPLVALSNEDVVRYSRILINDSSSRQLYGAQLLSHYQSHFSANVVSDALREALTGETPAKRAWFEVDSSVEFERQARKAIEGRMPALGKVVKFAEGRLGYRHRPDALERLKGFV